MVAIFAHGSKQYRVNVGDVIMVDSLTGEAGKTVTFDRVLFHSDKDKTQIGTPTVKGMTVKAKILGQEKGDKIHILRFKAKARERKRRGFRAQLTKLQVLSIG